MGRAVIGETDPRLRELLAHNPDLWAVGDKSGTVRLAVGADGELSTLTLAPQWWRNVKAESLGSLVLSLFTQSKTERAATVSQLERLPETAGPADTASPTAEASVSELSARMADVLAAFSELDRFRTAVEDATVAAATVKSDRGNVSIELVGGSPRALTVDPYNVQFVPPGELAAEIVRLFGVASNWLALRHDEVLRDSPNLLLVRERSNKRKAENG